MPESVALPPLRDSEVYISELPLKHDDLLWLANKHSLVIGVYTFEAPPLSFSSSTGRYQGMNADYLRILEKSLKVNLIIKQFGDEAQALTALKAGTIDAVLSSPTSDGALTSPFVASLPLITSFPMLVTRQTDMMSPLYNAHDEVRVATVLGYPSESFIKKTFPKSIITTYDDNYLALASVADNQNDYFFGDNLTSNFIITRDFFQSLQPVKFWREPKIGNHFVVLQNESNLLDILNTFINSLSDQAHKKVMQSWVNTGNMSFFTNDMKFTPQEERWMAKHPILRVLVNPYYAPLSMFDENQEIRGLVGDILNIIQLKTGLEFQPIIANSNNDISNIIHNGKWDLVPTATFSEEREEYMLFTHPFITTPFVLVMLETNHQHDIMLPTSKVAIPAYHPLSEKLKKKYPNVTWVTSENTSTALNDLMQGNVDAVVSTQLASRFIIERYYPGKMFYTRISDEPSAQIAFAIPRGSVELQSILNKILDDIPQKEMLDMAGKWIKAPDVKLVTWNLYNRPFYLVAGFAIVLVGSSLLWGIYLLRAIRRVKVSQTDLNYELIFRQTLFNAIPVPVYVITPEGDLKSYNNAFGQFFTPQLREALCFTLYDRRNPVVDVFFNVQQEIQQGLIPGNIITRQLMLNNGEEERLIQHWLISCQMPGNTPPPLICGWQDITDSKRLMKALLAEKDKAIEANLAKGRFLADMSHEIRTPISSIMGFLELLATRKQSPEEASEAIELACSTAQTLIGLIGDVLDMEKIESGNFTLIPEWVDLSSLIHSTVANFKGLAQKKNLRLIVDCCIEEGKMLWLDPQATQQVLSNLVSNAVKFTKEGEVEVKLRTKALDDGQMYLSLSVKDTGAGISEQERRQLFKPYSQTALGKRSVGSGLGLLICREMVERMSGQIAIASQPDMGTTMTVTLVTSTSDIKSSELLIGEEKALLPTMMRIVIAEDNPANRLLLRRQLDMLGYHVDEAEEGLQALEMIKNYDYDLLITDLNMPKMNGITLTQSVRQMNQHMIIWGLTANAQIDEKERCLAAGMNLCLFKPVNLQQLKTAFSSIHVSTDSPQLEEFVDMSLLEANCLGDKQLMCRMLVQSRIENDKDLVGALQAFKRQEWKLLQQHFHRINGTMQFLGATRLQYLAETLENTLAAGRYSSEIEEGIDQLIQQIRIFNEAINNFSQSI